MKKLIVLILLSAFTFSVNAQESGSFRGGIKVNPMISFLKTEPENPDISNVTSEGISLGFSYGVLGEYFFSENYGFSAELRIAHMGGTFVVTPKVGVDSTITRDLKLQYLELPFTLKMRTNEIGYMRYFGQFGFMPAFNLKARADITEQSGATSIQKNDRNVGKEMTPLVAYLVIGAGAEYSLGGATSIIGGLTFNNGFMNLWKKTDAEKVSVKPAYVALNLGVVF